MTMNQPVTSVDEMFRLLADYFDESRARSKEKSGWLDEFIDAHKTNKEGECKQSIPATLQQ